MEWVESKLRLWDEVMMRGNQWMEGKTAKLKLRGSGKTMQSTLVTFTALRDEGFEKEDGILQNRHGRLIFSPIQSIGLYAITHMAKRS